jgi:hypothetical protein
MYALCGAAGDARGEGAGPCIHHGKGGFIMGKKRSGLFVLGTTLAQNWGQSMVGIVRDKEGRQSPEAGQEGAMRKIAFLPVGFLLLLLSLGLLSFLPDAAAGDDDGCDKEAIVALGDTPIQGNAFLCIDSHSVRAKLHANGLTSGDAYTIWFIYTLHGYKFHF